MLLAAMLGLLLRLLVRGEYVFYVKPSFLPALIAAAIAAGHSVCAQDCRYSLGR